MIIRAFLPLSPQDRDSPLSYHVGWICASRQCYVLLRDTTTMVRVYRTTVQHHEDSTPAALAVHGSRVALGPNLHGAATTVGRASPPSLAYAAL